MLLCFPVQSTRRQRLWAAGRVSVPKPTGKRAIRWLFPGDNVRKINPLNQNGAWPGWELMFRMARIFSQKHWLQVGATVFFALQFPFPSCPVGCFSFFHFWGQGSFKLHQRFFWKPTGHRTQGWNLRNSIRRFEAWRRRFSCWMPSGSW